VGGSDAGSILPGVGSALVEARQRVGNVKAVSAAAATMHQGQAAAGAAISSATGAPAAPGSQAGADDDDEHRSAIQQQQQQEGGGQWPAGTTLMTGDTAPAEGSSHIPVGGMAVATGGSNGGGRRQRCYSGDLAATLSGIVPQVTEVHGMFPPPVGGATAAVQAGGGLPGIVLGGMGGAAAVSADPYGLTMQVC
jgi:hypothetical protein